MYIKTVVVGLTPTDELCQLQRIRSESFGPDLTKEACARTRVTMSLDGRRSAARRKQKLQKELCIFVVTRLSYLRHTVTARPGAKLSHSFFRSFGSKT